MRVLFAAQGPSHVQWQIPLAWAAQLAGHEVLVATRPPDVGQVTRAGLPAVPVGDEERTASLVRAVREEFVAAVRSRAAGQGGRPAPTEQELVVAGGRKMIAIADGMADDAVEVARRWRPEVVVHDTGALVGQVVAGVLGVPAFGHTWGATVEGVFGAAERQLRPSLAALFGRFGAEPESAGEPVWIDPSPPSMRTPLPLRRIDLRYTPYSGPGVLRDWLWGAERPRVCVTAGISGADPAAPWGGGVQGRVLEYLTGQGYEVVLAVRDASALAGGRLPEGVRVVESFPLNVLLPTCAAVVHHGGVGTGTTGLALGLPQLVLGAHLVHRQWGERVASAGAGLTLPVDASAAGGGEAAGELPKGLDDALERLVGDAALRAGARRVAAEIAAMPAPAEVVRILEERASEASSSRAPARVHAPGRA